MKIIKINFDSNHDQASLKLMLQLTTTSTSDYMSEIEKKRNRNIFINNEWTDLVFYVYNRKLMTLSVLQIYWKYQQ